MPAELDETTPLSSDQIAGGLVSRAGVTVMAKAECQRKENGPM